MSAERRRRVVDRVRGLLPPLPDEERKSARRPEAHRFAPSLRLQKLARSARVVALFLQHGEVARSAGVVQRPSRSRSARGIAFLALLALATTAADGALYRWVDEQGRVQYSDTPPTKDKGAVQLSNRGIVIKKLDGALTPEQQKAKDAEEARRKAEEARAAEQRRQDSALLQSFTTAEEIDMKRDREIQALEIMIENLREQERTTAARLAADRKRFEAASQGKKPPPQALKEDIIRGDAERKVLGEEIKRRTDEIASTRAKFEELKKRYIALKQESQLIQPVSAHPPSPAKK